jgi:hypothetical protein
MKRDIKTCGNAQVPYGIRNFWLFSQDVYWPLYTICNVPPPPRPSIHGGPCIHILLRLVAFFIYHYYFVISYRMQLTLAHVWFFFFFLRMLLLFIPPPPPPPIHTHRRTRTPPSPTLQARVFKHGILLQTECIFGFPLYFKKATFNTVFATSKAY